MRSPLTNRAGAPSRPSASASLSEPLHLGFVLFCEAGVEFGGVEFAHRGLLASDAVERGKALGGIPVLAGDLLAVGVEVIHVGPIDVAALRGQAVGVDRGVHGPGMNLDERKVLVDEAHLVLVVLQGGRETATGACARSRGTRGRRS